MKREVTCINYFIVLEKIFSREHTKNPNAYVRARPDVTFWAVGYHWGGGGGGNDVLKIFFYEISVYGDFFGGQ